MDEEEGVATPSTSSVSTPPSPPMRGTKVKPLNGGDRSNGQERVRPSVFQGDGLEAFIEMYGTGDETTSPEVTLPPTPMERYEHWKEEVPWRLRGTMNGDVVKEVEVGREGNERERRLSNVVDSALKVFSGTEESLNLKPPVIIKTEGKDVYSTVTTDETHESLFRDLMVPSRIERRKKMLARGGVHAHVRQRKSPKKDHDALAVKTSEVTKTRKGTKGKWKGNSVASDESGYDSSQRLRGFSVSDEEEKRVKTVKPREKRV